MVLHSFHILDKQHKDASYEVAVISEKSDSTQEITRSNDGLKWSEDETMDNSDDDDNDENNTDDYDDNSQRSNDDNTNETVLKVVKVINLKLKIKLE